MASTADIKTFDDFWPYYVGEHRHPTCRALHYVGTSLAIGSCAMAAATMNPLWLVGVPVAGYSFAWAGHFLFEGNRPATFKHPLWSLRADFKMLGMALQGKMADEVTRLCGTARHAPDDPSVAPV